MKKENQRKFSLHLVCNAHLDPVWLWTWKEGAAEALSTFRTAARLCRKFDGFIFCHNEALLYQWIREYAPSLFSEIQELVRLKKWHIMGGWFLQPDCNMPSGESFVRQVIKGKNFFMEHFGVEPGTAVNLDSFGHSRGLVQILKKSGYDSYLFCRPGPENLDLPGEDFIWVGYDGSEILAHREGGHYNSRMGEAGEKVEQWISARRDKTSGLVLWGIGNHGGGPSREDLKNLRSLIEKEEEGHIRHSTPEHYFAEVDADRDPLPLWPHDLNPWAVGCYTSMARIKQEHRKLENSYYLTEKMAVHATISGLNAYPKKELDEALEDLLYSEFHDILPGSSIAEVEDHSLQRLSHGKEILERIRARCFFDLTTGEKEADEGEYPLFVYNPHPFSFRSILEVEFQPPEPLRETAARRIPEMKDAARNPVACQLEKESSSLSLDWRKKVVFEAELKPSRMNRFSCVLKERHESPQAEIQGETALQFQSNTAEFIVDKNTGWLSAFRIHGVDYLEGNTLKTVAYEDTADSWGMLTHAFRTVSGEFKLMSPEESAQFAGVSKETLSPVRIVEQGPVRRVVEAFFKYASSFLCVRYYFPVKGSEFEIRLRVFCHEKDRMFKLSVRTPFAGGRCMGQVPFGIEDFSGKDREFTAQMWTAVLSSHDDRFLRIVNDGTYGFDFVDGEIRCSLLRSAAYAAHPVGEGRPVVEQDRYTPRIDQGERFFRFWFDGGRSPSEFQKTENAALVHNEFPPILCFFPDGGGEVPLPGAVLSDPVVRISACKREERENRIVLRLFEPTGNARKTRLTIPALEFSREIVLGGFEVKTLLLDGESGMAREVDLMEKPLGEKSQGIGSK